ncbi:MAG: ABC transporter ATP-binding protein [Chloroflexi bacterium]|nr:ABC transporter ATP-binding protein [Chloroflexota bacterium]
MALIQTQDLLTVYGSGEATLTALNRVNIQINAGNFVAVMGPSGCGKSTLLNLIGGLDRPSGGSVLMDGVDIAKLDDAKMTEMRRRKIGFVFQFFNLIPVLNAIENAALPLTLNGTNSNHAKEKAKEWLSKVGLDKRLTSYPDQLSAGQQQRVAIARALVADPTLVLADEPTGNLDSRSADDVASLLRKVADEWNRTVLMVTHDPRIAAYADRIIFLKDGAVEDDTWLAHGSIKARILKEKVDAQ